MPAPISHRPSFSPSRRWRIGFNLALRTALVCAVAVMVNYLAAQFSHRFYLSSQTRIALSPRTLSVLHSLTNHIAVTLYYDKRADFYSEVLALLNEYHEANPLISLKAVDYVRDAGEAEKIKAQYHLNTTDDKDLVIFDAGNGHYKVGSGDALVQYKLEAELPKNPTQRQLEFEKKPVAFRGEEMFTATVLALENSKPFKAYFLQGDGEPSLDDSSGTAGYLQFGATLAQNYVAVTNLELFGDNPVPSDCNLLIIAGPKTPLSDPELQKIDQYLAQGGRLMVLFDYNSIQRPTGLEPILQNWGVKVAADYVKDPDTISHWDVVVRKFSQHPIVNSLIQSELQMYLPRPVGRIDRQNPPGNALEVDELASSSSGSTLAGNPAEPPRSYPLMVAVEQKPAAGVAGPRGNTRIVVAGDSVFLGNYYIRAGSNREFLNNAINWLLDRPSLLQGIGQRPVSEFRLLLTQPQRQELRWLLLAALPGAVLLFGGLVWLVRRK